MIRSYLLNMQDIVGANCGCGSETTDSTSIDGQKEKCSICGKKLVEMTHYGGATISVCPNCNWNRTALLDPPV